MNIPAPGHQYNTYSYGGLRQNSGVNDLSSNYGMQGGSYGYDPAIENYKQKLADYIQYARNMLSRVQAGDPDRVQIEGCIQQAYQYAQEVGLPVQQLQDMGSGWDPLTGNIPQNVTFPISYEDTNHIVTDEGASTNITVGANDPITKQIDAYQKENTLQIPSNAASVSVTETIDNSNPDKADRQLKVTITFPNGTTRTLIYHHAEREGFSLNLQVADPSQVIKDASLGEDSSKLNVTELGSTGTESEQAGDQPTRMDGATRVFDGQDFDISPVAEGKNKESKVMASGDVFITPNSNEEYYVMDYQDGKYVVKVYASEEDKANNKIKETISIDGALVNSVQFLGDESRMEFGDALKSADDAHTLNDSKEAEKISLENEEEDSVNFDDTAADSKEGKINIYDQSPEVNIHANHDDKTNTHEIWASTSATIHGESNRDTMTLDYNAEKDEMVVAVYKNGDLSSRPEIFIIHNAKDTDITVDVMSESSIVDSDDAVKNMVQIGLDGTSAAEKAAEVAKPDEEKSEASRAIIDNLLSLTGTNETQLLSQLRASGYTYDNIDKLQQAIESGAFPPSKPDTKLIKFLAAMDATLDGLYKELKRNGNNAAIRSQAANRLVELLQALYPDHIVRQSFPNASPENSVHLLDDISFDGQNYHWFSQNQDNFNAGELNFYSVD